MYEFSIPLLYDKEIIDKLVTYNNSLTKSKIVSLYDSLPAGSKFQTGLEQARGKNPKVNSLGDFLDYVSYVKDSGFKFIYLFNSTLGINTNDLEKYNLIKKNLDILINALSNVGCKSYRVANTFLIQYLSENYPELEIIASTTLAYSSALEYENLLKIYPNITEFCLHYENNHNFKLLKNLINNFPNTGKEILVNELCIKGCPLRNSHFNFVMSKLYPEVVNLHEKCFRENCAKMFYNNIWETVCTSNIIYPWMVKDYSETGINKFKMVGREYSATKESYNYYTNYLKALEDEEYMMNMNFFSLFYNPSTLMLDSDNYIDLKVKDVIEYLPDIKHYIAHGHNCASVCKMECNYCYDKAKILNEKFPLNK